MSSVIEDYAKEYAKEENTKTAILMLKDGVSVETIAKFLPSLSLDFIKQLQQQLPQA